ncbi:MAG: AAA family ATPase [Firmicutes bacterium]|nr:AAA family ATPase [Bacillota bacterium]
MSAIKIPATTLVILCGPAGCGKSTFAKKHFLDTQIVSSDRCRALVSDDENDMSASSMAFKLFYLLIGMRLTLGRLTVADSTALDRSVRTRLIKLAAKHHFHTLLVLFNVPLELCLRQNNSRERNVEPSVIKKHMQKLGRIARAIPEEGYHWHYILDREQLQQIKMEII